MRTYAIPFVLGLFLAAFMLIADAQVIIFTPDGQIMGQKEIEKIYEASQKCELQIIAASPSLVQRAKVGDGEAKKAFAALHYKCMERELDASTGVAAGKLR